MTFAARRRGGAASAVLNLNNINLLATDRTIPYNAWAYFRVKNDGEVWFDEANNNAASSEAFLQTWLSGGDPTEYSVRLVKTVGTDPTLSSLNTWYSLSTYSSRQWYWEVSGEGAADFQGILSIAKTSDTTTVLASCTVYVEISCGLAV